MANIDDRLELPRTALVNLGNIGDIPNNILVKKKAIIRSFGTASTPNRNYLGCVIQTSQPATVTQWIIEIMDEIKSDNYQIWQNLSDTEWDNITKSITPDSSIQNFIWLIQLEPISEDQVDKYTEFWGTPKSKLICNWIPGLLSPNLTQLEQTMVKCANQVMEIWTDKVTDVLSWNPSDKKIPKCLVSMQNYLEYMLLFLFLRSVSEQELVSTLITRKDDYYQTEKNRKVQLVNELNDLQKVSSMFTALTYAHFGLDPIIQQIQKKKEEIALLQENLTRIENISLTSLANVSSTTECMLGCGNQTGIFFYCGHHLCVECFFNVLANQKMCPFCRLIITIDNCICLDRQSSIYSLTPASKTMLVVQQHQVIGDKLAIAQYCTKEIEVVAISEIDETISFADYQEVVVILLSEPEQRLIASKIAQLSPIKVITGPQIPIPIKK